MQAFFDIHVTSVTLMLAMCGCLLVGYWVGYNLRKKFTEYQIKEAEALREKILKEAEIEVETQKKAAQLEIKEEKMVIKNQLNKEKDNNLQALKQQEEKISRKQSELGLIADKNKENENKLKDRSVEIEKKSNHLDAKITEYDDLIEQELGTLEKIASYSVAEAKDAIKNKILEEARLDAAIEVKRLEEKVKANSEDEARRIISMAVQRIASDHVAESTVSVVELPNDEIKGRIIGREGRNIRALEQCTGIDLIIDDTPGAVVLSGFDPIRREVAKRALEKLTLDGRIHPGRIEEVVEKCKKEINQGIIAAGDQALMDVGIDNIHPDMIKLLGRLMYRTSYTQNVLQHSKEVAWVCGVMAAELGLDVKMAKRAGLLHDIGKAIDKQTDGTHTQLGVEIANRYNEHKYVVNAIASHHEDVEQESVYAVLVSASDTISASRPGARREMLESYIKRMTQLEEIGDSFKGVEKTYAIQAGREVRIMVMPNGISDDEVSLLAKDVAKQIEKEVTYPGEIRITVIRESRYVETAR